jgi:glycosyltransferase involved in cell wall biosynthesis
MRIGFNARVPSESDLKGWNRYTLNLASALADLGAEVYLYSDRPCDLAQLAQLPASKLMVRKSPSMSYLRWEQIWIPQQCALDNIDIFHSPIYFGLPQWRKTKCVLTLHDVIDNIYYANKRNTTNTQRITKVLCWMTRHRADHVITVSEYSRRELIKHFQLPEDRVTVTYAAADERFHQAISAESRKLVREKYQLPEEFVFYLGSLEPRKNIPFLLRAFAIAAINSLHVVIGGGNKTDCDALQDFASSLGIEDRVSLLGRVNDADLPALYAEAKAFIYPSECEGFGLQICEAIAVGCPVFVADSSSLPEILGDGGEIFSLSDPSPLAKILVKLTSDRNYREDLKMRSQRRSQFFSWKDTARKTLTLYEKFCLPPRKTYFWAGISTAGPAEECVIAQVAEH